MHLWGAVFQPLFACHCASLYPSACAYKALQNSFEIVFIPFERRGASNAGSKQTVCLIRLFLFLVMWQVMAWTTAWPRRAQGMTMTRIKRRSATRREGSSLRWPPTLWEHGSFSTLQWVEWNTICCSQFSFHVCTLNFTHRLFLALIHTFSIFLVLLLSYLIYLHSKEHVHAHTHAHTHWR